VKSKFQHAGIWSAAAGHWPAACVIVQQYSSPTFLSLRLQNVGVRFKNIISNFFLLLKTSVRLELRTFELHKVGVSVYWLRLNVESRRERVRNSLLHAVLRDLGLKWELQRRWQIFRVRVNEKTHHPRRVCRDRLMARSHICKLCIYNKNFTIIYYLFLFFLVRPANQPTITGMALYHKMLGSHTLNGILCGYDSCTVLKLCEQYSLRVFIFQTPSGYFMSLQ
jgi:hypothetical protein